MIELHQLGQTFTLGQTQVHALSDINLSIDEGEFVALTGPSGSGKTTLLNLLGLIDQPASGRLQLNQQWVQDLSESELTHLRRQSIGYVFQHFNLIPTLSAAENIAYSLELLGENPANTQQAVSDILQVIGLAEHGHHKPDQLSGGQRQRVAIARALIKKPSLIIADEPTAALDQVTALTMMKLMKDLCQQQQTTLVVSTHDPRILHLVDRTIELLDGRVVKDTASNQVAS